MSWSRPIQVTLRGTAKNVLADFTAKVHLQNPNQSLEAIIIHFHPLVLEGLRTGGRFVHFSTNPHQNRHRVHRRHPVPVLLQSPRLISPGGSLTRPACQESHHLQKNEIKCDCICARSPLLLLPPQSLNMRGIY